MLHAEIAHFGAVENQPAQPPKMAQIREMRVAHRGTSKRYLHELSALQCRRAADRPDPLADCRIALSRQYWSGFGSTLLGSIVQEHECGLRQRRAQAVHPGL